MLKRQKRVKRETPEATENKRPKKYVEQTLVYGFVFQLLT